MLSLVASAGSAAAAGATTGTSSAALIGRTVTLITGDRVTVADDGRMSISRAKGQDGIRFLTARVGGHLRVIPSDALPLLRADRLDGRLFDVKSLLDFGYTRRTELAADRHQRRRRFRSLLGGPAPAREWSGSCGGQAVRAAQHHVLDGPDEGREHPGHRSRQGLAVRVAPAPLDVSVPQIGARQWRGRQVRRPGVTVGLLDGGNRREPMGVGGDEDTDCHGTHVASTILGAGAASAGRYRGVALGPSCCPARYVSLADAPSHVILAGMQWVAENVAIQVGGHACRPLGGERLGSGRVGWAVSSGQCIRPLL
jgi:subtilisin family serine protease